MLLTLASAIRAAETGAAADIPRQACPAPLSAGAIQLSRTGERVQAALHTALTSSPATDCTDTPLFLYQVPAPYRPPFAVWRDVSGQAMRADGTPDPTHPDPLSIRLWVHPDGRLQYDAAVAQLGVEYFAYDLQVGWGTTGAANDLAVLDILNAALAPEELGAELDDSGRVDWLVWNQRNLETRFTGIHPPDMRVAWELPSELGQLSQLAGLVLGGPLLTGEIPPEVGQLRKLRQLTLAGNQLTQVPSGLKHLSNPTKLDLSANWLAALPPDMGLDQEQPWSRPAGRGQVMESLRLIGIWLRTLRNAPLVYLNLSGNQLTALPATLGQLVYLEHLDLSDNQLTDLPETLDQLTDLKYLDLSGNHMTSRPAALGQMNRLEELNLSDNPLEEIPLHAKTFPHLKRLDLSGTALTTLPSSLEEMRLVRLALRRQLLTDLPAELGRIAQWPWPLTSLNLSHNQLAGPLLNLAHLPPLYRLDLRGNPLTTCLLPLPWQVERFIYPPSFNTSLMYPVADSPPGPSQPTDLPFWAFCRN